MSPVDTAVLALVLAILATMPAFALKSRQRAQGADAAKRRPTTLILRLWVRNWFMWLLGPVERPPVCARASPDMLNWFEECRTGSAHTQFPDLHTIGPTHACHKTQVAARGAASQQGTNNLTICRAMS